MRSALFATCLLSLGSFLWLAAGCQTTQPGATDTLGVYSTHIDGAPDQVTSAAQKACNDMKLLDVNSTGTKVDGKVTARTAQGSDVAINIEQAGENVSKVTIQVGVTGDETVSKQLVDRIRNHLAWFGL